MCGILACIGIENTGIRMENGLKTLQHRGQASFGYAFKKDGKIISVIEEGLVRNRPNIEDDRAVIAHVRYATTGGEGKKNAQPLVIKGCLAIAHNGDLIDTEPVRKKLLPEIGSFQTDSDSEIILHLIDQHPEQDKINALVEVLNSDDVKGAYSIVGKWNGYIFAARDPRGFRPLVLGRTKKGFVFASETAAFEVMDVEYIRQVEPGEIIAITPDLKIRQYQLKKKADRLSHCIFELVYFARPDSIVFGYHVGSVRYNLGKTLGKELIGVDDFSKYERLVPILDSGRTATLGLGQTVLREIVKQLILSGVKIDDIPEDLFPMYYAINRNQYSFRTFIEGLQKVREAGLSVKHNVDRVMVANKRVYYCDDTIVRGNTAKKHTQNFRDRGAREVHARIASPPIKFPCFYGIEMKERGKLIAANNSVEEIALETGMNSLIYLSLEGFKSCVKKENFCFACFDGHYPELPG